MSARLNFLSTLCAISALPLGLAAQERQPRTRVFINEEAPEVIRNRIRAVVQRRARLGVTVDMRASENDSVGATLRSVTPGGPAAKAGLRSGDIITGIGGKSLLAANNMRAGEDESLPGMRLVEFAAQLKPNDTVAVEYRRGAAKRTASLITGDEPVMAMEGLESGGMFEFNAPEGTTLRRMPFEGGGSLFKEHLLPGGGDFTFMFGGGLANLELAPLNPDLGAYFGTAEGILVINLPKESTLGLKAGDVILSVDGRKAASPGSLLRILRTYEPGETFKFEVMRNKARTTVSGMLEKKRDE